MIKPSLRPGRQTGVALVTVLWFLVLLSVLAFGYSKSIRLETKIARNLLDAVTARHLADAAVERGIFELLRPVATKEDSILLGVPIHFRFEQARLSFTIRDERGKIDINKASPELLEGLFLVLEVEPDRATALAEAIVDWRDEDDLRQLNGAEEAEYRAAGLDIIPSNAPFRSIVELQMVLGMDKRLYDKVRSNVTVHSFSDKINTLSAPPAVLLALPNIDSSQVEAFVEERSQLEQGDAGSPLPILSDISGLTTDRAGPVYSIEGSVTLTSGASTAREWTIWIPNRKDDMPFYVLNSQSISARQSGEGLVQ
jgi:general secretion pathway protein K